MAKEILTVPEDRLAEVIAVIRAGLAAAANGAIEISAETIMNLEKWCDAEEAYLNERNRP